MYKYELFKLENDKYQIHSDMSGFKAMEGTTMAIIYYMVKKLGFELSEVEFAMHNMIQKDFDGAHFGFARSFLFSYERNPVREISA